MPREAAATRGRVLVVDDDPIVLRALARTIQRLDYAVVAEGDPAQALQRLAAEPFDVVLADLNLPLQTGRLFAVCARERFPGVPLLVVTGEDDEQRIQGMLEGATVRAVLKKPARPSVLARALGDAAASPPFVPEAV